MFPALLMSCLKSVTRTEQGNLYGKKNSCWFLRDAMTFGLCFETDPPCPNSQQFHSMWFHSLFGWCVYFSSFVFLNVFNFLLLCYYNCPNFTPLCTPPPSPPSRNPSSQCCLCLWVMHICPLSNLHHLSPSFHLPPPLSELSVCFCASDFILLISLFSSLGSSYKWDHMVLVFFCLAYFT